MRRRLALATVLALFVSVMAFVPRGGALAQPAPPTAPAALPTGVNVVRATYDNLLDVFFRPLDPVELLTAGWDALADASAQLGIPVPPELPPLPADREGAFAAFERTFQEYLTTLPAAVNPRDVGFVISAGMAESLNEGHTTFIPPANVQALQASLSNGELPVGLGVMLRFASAPWLVAEVVAGGPADQAGMIAGDIIIASDGVDLSGASRATFAQATGGPSGTVRRITVDRGGERRDLTVTRAPYYAAPLESRVLPGNVGYLRLREFPTAGLLLPNGTEIVSDLDRRLDAFDAAGVRGLVLDLRGNGGGDLFFSLELIGRFVTEDTLAGIDFDERGHQAILTGSGLMRRNQTPMAVLVDGGSASASELTAATLREANRAILVGRRTAGVLAGAYFLSLPEGAALEVATVEYVTPSGFKVDEVGFPVDIEVGDTRTTADFLAGRDPQIQAALDALGQAPPAPLPRSTTTGVSAADLRAALSPYMPDPASMPTNANLTSVNRTSTRDFTHPNQRVNFFGPPRDPLALAQTLRDRGWLGSHTQEYGGSALFPPSVVVSVDLYTTPEGAAAAVAADDAPDVLQRVSPSVQLGEGTAAFRTIGFGIGGPPFGLGEMLVWRRGAVVLTVMYADTPGREQPETLAAIANLVDQAYLRAPLPTTGVKKAA